MNIRTLFNQAFSHGIVKHKGFRVGYKDGIDPAQFKASLAEALKERDNALQLKLDAADLQIKETGKVSQQLKDEIANHVKASADLQTRLEGMEQELVALKAARESGNQATKSHGELFCESEDFKNFVTKGRGTAVLRLKTISDVTSATTAGPAVYSDRLPGIITPAIRTFTIRQLLMPGRTSSNSIEYIKETGFQNSAAAVAEGALKPQSDITFSRATSNVRTLAHWLRASNQILADVPQLESYINTRLTYGLKYVEETQLLSGDGTGQNLLGLIPQATPYNDALRVNGDTDIDTLRRAILQVRLALYHATGIVLNPQDWANIELTKDTMGRYIWVNVATGGAPQLWRLPVVESDAIPAGYFMVGAFNMAAQLFDREDANVQVSTEDGNNFTENMVTIRVEERLALVVYRPASFVYGPFIKAT
jgi:HK97 family phage major capsid protein